MKTVLVLQFLAAILAFAAAAGTEVAMTAQPGQTVVACGNGSGIKLFSDPAQVSTPILARGHAMLLLREYSRRSLSEHCVRDRQAAGLPSQATASRSNAWSLESRFSAPPSNPYGSIAKARVGNPRPSRTLGQLTTMRAPADGTLSRLAITSI
jgi:hypothetical protein